MVPTSRRRSTRRGSLGHLKRGLMKFKQIIASILLCGLVLLAQDTTTGLTNIWRFDEGSGNAVADGAGTVGGTLINSPTWTTAGVGGAALQFNGQQSVNLSSGIGLSGTFTL